MTRLNLLFFALLISYIHNFYSEFNEIFLQSFFFLFLFEFMIIKLFFRCRRNQTNQQNQTNEDDDDSLVSDIEEDEKIEDKLDTDNKCEEKIETNNKETEDKVNEEDKITKGDNSEETEEESDSNESKNSSDEPVDITEGVDVNQMEILRLLNNYESLGDSGLMELKKKMLELDKLVEFYKNDTKKTKKE
jgi:hypothetical protein